MSKIMSRSPGLTATAMTLLVVSSAWLAMSLFVFLGVALGTFGLSRSQPEPMELLRVGLPSLLPLFGVITAIGLLGLKTWAKICAVAIAWLIALSGVIALINLLFPQG